MAGRGAQVFLEGYARDLARGGVGRSVRENVEFMDAMVLAGLVADGNRTMDGTTNTGGRAYDPVIAQFPHDPLHAWEIPAPLLQWPSGAGNSMVESGAAGDGVTDDQPAIQAFLNEISAQGGGQVLLPPNTWYAISAAPLTIPPNVWVRGGYNALGANSQQFFSGGGFMVNPALSAGIIMSAASSLTNCKVYRQGLVQNASTDLVNSSVAVWAAEAVRLVTTVLATSTTVLTFASVSGVTPGMAVTANGVTMGTTVVSSNATTVTLSAPMTVQAGVTVRFGGSIGIRSSTGQSGIVLDHVRVIGFNSGIITASAQHFYSNIEADNIYNAEWINAADGCWARNFHFIPWYGQSQTLIPPRPGDSVFIHDAGIGLHIHGMQSFGWQNGVHLKNCSGPAMLFDVFCETQGPLTTGAGCKGFWIDKCSSVHLHGCHAQGQSIGFHVFDSTIVEMVGCAAHSGAIGGTAHYYVENPTVAGRMGLLNCSSYGTAVGMPSFVFAAGELSYCKFIPGYIIAPTMDPCIVIDPSVSQFINRVSTADAEHSGLGTIQSYMREKLYLEGSGTATTDGSPTATLTVKLQDSLSTQAQIISLLRNNAEAASIEITNNALYLVPTNNLYLGKANFPTTMQGTTVLSQWFSQSNMLALTPTTGDTISWNNFAAGYIINSTGTLAALTINLPTVAISPDRVILKVVFSVAITALTIATTDGALMKPTLTSAAAGTAVNFVLNKNISVWHVWV